MDDADADADSDSGAGAEGAEGAEDAEGGGKVTLRPVVDVVDDEVGAVVELARGVTEGDVLWVPAGAGSTAAAPLLVGTARGRAAESVSLDR